MFPERFSNLPEYAFPRLRRLLDEHPPGGDVVHMTIGEPKHDFPPWIVDIIKENAAGFGKYPVNEGKPELLEAITTWIGQRYGVVLDSTKNVMALNGTREGLYNAMMAVCPEVKNGQPKVLLPNPFYQVYMVAAISVGAGPVLLNATPDNGYMPDFTALSPDILNQVAVAYLCSPSNPQGAVATREYWSDLIQLAEKYDFKVFADECYSEIYRGDEPPVGALQVAHDLGADPERVLAFHSLSKRSNLPGLRSGFVAGGPESIARIRQLRNYSGSPLPMPLQHVAEKVWADESHVIENRRLYQEKYDLADEIMAEVPGYKGPEAGFFLWLPVTDGEKAALKAWVETGVRVLPGAYLSREADGFNPGKEFIRVALVAPKEETEQGLIRLRDCLYK